MAEAPNDSIDTIFIGTTRRGDIAADRAVLGVTIEGSSLITGQSALHKAREVKVLADALREFGVEEKDIELEGVSATTSSGTFSKSSSARYSLRIRISNLEQLPDIIGIIAAQKNTSVRPTQWSFPDQGAWRDEWLDDCLQRANARAARVAGGLKVPLLGVHRFAEIWSDDIPNTSSQPDWMGADESRPMMARSRSLTSDDLGLSVLHTKSVTLSVSVQYRVGRFESAS